MILDKPAWVISDEAIDLTDTETRELVVSIFGKELAGSTFFNISGRQNHDPFYSRTIRLTPLGAPDAPAPAKKGARHG
jgi:ABC-type uncharacterized transport system fused permease/ATPase subunit